MMILIGEAPGRGQGDYTRAFEGSRSGAFIKDAFGPAFSANLSVRINVVQRSQRKSGKGSAFDAERFELAVESTVANALSIAYDADPTDLYLLIAGKRLAKAIGIPSPEYFAEVSLPLKYSEYEREIGLTSAIVIPHPSGVNRWWNDKANRKVAASFAQRMNRRTW